MNKKKVIPVTCTSTHQIEVNQLQPIQGNLKTRTREQLQNLKSMILKYGFSFPIYVWQDKEIFYTLDGHGRDFVCKELIKEGFQFKQKDGNINTTLPCIFIDAKNKVEAKEKLLAVNSSYGRITEEGLYAYLFEPGFELNFEEIKLSLDLPEIDLNKISLADYNSVPSEVLNDVPDINDKTFSKINDLFIFDGRHRVMCGDSTQKKDVQKLMGKIKADMVFTDPPYNVDYEGGTKEKLTIKNDAMDENAYSNFLKRVFDNYRIAIKDGAGLYLCHASSWQKLTEEIMNKSDLIVRNQIIWAKNTFAWGMGRYKYQHEPIFYAHVKGKSDAWYGDKTQSTLWQVNKPSKSEEHPTMKPVELVMMAIINSSKMSDVILDLFLGSGSTLISCEQTNRICYGMEIDPIYVDVILRRYHALYPEKEIKCLNRKFDFKGLYANN